MAPGAVAQPGKGSHPGHRAKAARGTGRAPACPGAPQLTRVGEAAISAFAIAAPAKVNLYLHVLGRRDDGYHRLDSLIAFVAAGDRVETKAARDLALAIEGPFAPGLSAGEDNLVLRAARAIAATSGDGARGAAIRLIKNLPVASGIGGGSSDAAATLRALNELWRLGCAAETLARIGLRLGADVPVCLAGRTALVGGVGEVIRPGPELPRFGVVLVNPGVPVPTGAVFNGLHGRFSAPAPPPPTGRSAADFVQWLGQCGNSLTSPATAIAPVIDKVLTAVAATSGCLLARLSGSGATCFGLYPDHRSAEAAARELASGHPRWWTTSTRFIETPPLPEPVGRERG